MGRTLIIALGLLAAAPALAAGQAGAVRFLEGEAARVRGGAESSLSIGDALEVGDSVQTGPGARVEILLADESMLRLDEDSRVVIDEIDHDEESWSVRLSLAAGALWSKVSRRVGDEARFEVRTERMVAGVRGTEFLVQAKAEHLVEVYEGRVEVGLVEGGRFRLSPMESLRVNARGQCGGAKAIAKHVLQTRSLRQPIGDRKRGAQERPDRKVSGEGGKLERPDREGVDEHGNADDRRSEDGRKLEKRRTERKLELRQRALERRDRIRERLRR